MADVASFDPRSAEVLERGPAAYAELRGCPFGRQQGEFDFYIDTDYRGIRNILLKDTDLWSSRWGPGPVDAGAFKGVGILSDPPEHDHVRRLLQRGFSPQKLATLSREVDRIADDLIDAMLQTPEREGDFYALFAAPLPSRLMCIMLGAPEADWPNYKRWSDELIVEMMNAPDRVRSDAIAQELAPHFFAMIHTRRERLREAGVEEPGPEHVGDVVPDDFLSRFICDRVDGRRLNDLEVLSLGVTIMNAGNETTINLITNLLWRLLEVPERWEQLKAAPHLVENAVEESLRYDPPVLGMWRKATRETELQGQHLPEGTRVMYCIAAANRDPALWEEPDVFRIDRTLPALRKHLSFASGPHVCAGLQLARLEAKQVFDKLVTRLPKLRLTGASDRIGVFNFWGRSRLPVAWG